MSKKILIVDDNGINRKYAKSVLSKIGVDIFDVDSGRAALNLMGKHSFDLVLMDIQMPEMDGFQTLERVKIDYPNFKAPILAITAFYGDDGKSTFLDAGFDQFIQKPIKPDQLIKIVEGWLSQEQVIEEWTISKNQEIIDKSVYNEIKKYARGEDINDLYSEFEEESTVFFERLNFLITSKNYPEILSTLHVIKGNSGSLGINELASKAEKLEADIRSNVTLDLRERIEELERIFGRYKQEYKQLLNI